MRHGMDIKDRLLVMVFIYAYLPTVRTKWIENGDFYRQKWDFWKLSIDAVWLIHLATDFFYIAWYPVDAVSLFPVLWL